LFLKLLVHHQHLLIILLLHLLLHHLHLQIELGVVGILRADIRIPIKEIDLVIEIILVIERISVLFLIIFADIIVPSFDVLCRPFARVIARISGVFASWFVKISRLQLTMLQISFFCSMLELLLFSNHLALVLNNLAYLHNIFRKSSGNNFSSLLRNNQLPFSCCCQKASVGFRF
jgi:hypothetical protein